MNNPLSNTDRALCVYLISQGIGSDNNVRPFKRSDSKEVPLVICYSHRAMPLTAFCGTYDVEASIYIRTNAAVDVDQSEDEPKNANRDLVDQVFEALHRLGDGAQSTESLADAINNSGGGGSQWSCQSAEISSIEAMNESGHSLKSESSDCWTDIISIRLKVAERDVS